MYIRYRYRYLCRRLSTIRNTTDDPYLTLGFVCITEGGTSTQFTLCVFVSIYLLWSEPRYLLLSRFFPARSHPPFFSMEKK